MPYSFQPPNKVNKGRRRALERSRDEALVGCAPVAKDARWGGAESVGRVAPMAAG
jgi:hypothetical protein